MLSVSRSGGPGASAFVRALGLGMFQAVALSLLFDEHVDDEAQGGQHQDEEENPHSTAAPASASTSATNYYSASTSHDYPFAWQSMCAHTYPTRSV